MFYWDSGIISYLPTITSYLVKLMAIQLQIDTCDIFSKSCGYPSEPFINDVTKNMGEVGKVLLWHKHNA